MKRFYEVGIDEMRRVDGGWGLCSIFSGAGKVLNKALDGAGWAMSKVTGRIPGPAKIFNTVVGGPLRLVRAGALRALGA